MKSKGHSQARPSAGAFLHGLLVQLSTQASADLLRMPGQPERSMHALRTRMKKIRSLLRLARSQMDTAAWQAISSAARDIKDAFGTQRNREVMERLRNALSGAKTGDARPRKAAVPRRVWPRLRELQNLLATLPLQALTWEDLCTAHLKTCQAARKRMHCAEDGGDEALHRWRKRVKDVYYQSLALHRFAALRKRIRQSRRLGSRLGKHHDLDVLRTSARPELSPTELRRLEKRQETLEKQVFKLGPKLLEKDPRLAKHL